MLLLLLFCQYFQSHQKLTTQNLVDDQRNIVDLSLGLFLLLLRHSFRPCRRKTRKVAQVLASLLTGIQNVVRRQCQYCCTWKYSQQLWRSLKVSSFCHKHMLGCKRLKKKCLSSQKVEIWVSFLFYYPFLQLVTLGCSFSLMIMTQFPHAILFVFFASSENAICKNTTKDTMWNHRKQNLPRKETKENYGHVTILWWKLEF